MATVPEPAGYGLNFLGAFFFVRGAPLTTQALSRGEQKHKVTPKNDNFDLVDPPVRLSRDEDHTIVPVISKRHHAVL